jgi:hypothetical protein
MGDGVAVGISLSSANVSLERQSNVTIATYMSWGRVALLKGWKSE